MGIEKRVEASRLDGLVFLFYPTTCGVFRGNLEVACAHGRGIRVELSGPLDHP